MRRERPDVRGLLAVLERFAVEYVVTGSVAALLVGVDLEPGDLDVTPAPEPENLKRLAQALADLEARRYPDEPFGRWTTDENGEWRWVTFEPTEADRQARAAWKPDPCDVDSFDHLLWTRLGTLDVVPENHGEIRRSASASCRASTARNATTMTTVAFVPLVNEVTLMRRIVWTAPNDRPTAC